MSSSKTHFKLYGQRKKHKDYAMQDNKRKKQNKKTCSSHADKLRMPSHEIAQKLQVSIHAAERYAERIFGMNKRDLDGEQLYKIAKAIRESLPSVMLNEARYNVVDNYYAIVNNGMVVTIISVGRKK